MTFLAPGAGLLAAAIALPAIALLYFLKLRRRPLRVSSTFLWAEAAKDLQVNVPFRWLRLSWLLLLQVLVALCLCAAIARPAVEGAGAAAPGGRVLILIDRSASMQAMDGRGPGGEVVSRLDEAKRRALEALDALTRRTAQGAQVAVAAFASDAAALTPFTRDGAALRESVEALTPTDQPGSLDAGVRLARALALDAGEDGGDVLSLIIVSDGGFARGDLPAGKGLAVRYERVGPAEVGSSGDANAADGGPRGYDNAGLVALSARRDYEDPGTVRIFARVHSAAGGVRPITLRLSLNGTTVEERVVRVSPAEGPGAGEEREEARAGEIGGATAGGDAPASFTLLGREGGVVTVSILEPDLLASDNTAGLVLPAARPARLLLVAPGNGGAAANPFLLSLLGNVEEATLRVADAETYEQLAAGVREGDRAGAGGGASADRRDDFPFDLVLFDRVAPARRPACPSVSFGAGLPSLGVTVKAPSAGPEARADRFVSWKREHPLLRYVNLDSVVIDPAMAITLSPPGATTGEAVERAPEATDLADGASGPLIMLIDDAGTARVVLGFALGRTNWPPTLSFPVFLANAIDFLTLRGESGGGRSFTTDQGVIVPAARGVQEVSLWPVGVAGGAAGGVATGAAGGSSEARAGSGPVVRASVPTGAGAGDGGRGGGGTGAAAPVALGLIERAGLYEARGAAPGYERVAVNLLDSTESSLRVAPALDLLGGALPASSGAPAPREVWHWFVLAALGLLSIEWFVYAWRMRA